MKYLHCEAFPLYRKLISALLNMTEREHRRYFLLFSLYLLKHLDFFLYIANFIVSYVASQTLLSCDTRDLYGAPFLCGKVYKNFHFLTILLPIFSLVLKILGLIMV